MFGVYYKSTLHLRILNISNLDECINFEVSIANKICHFIHLYRSRSQKQDEFQEFKSNLKVNLDALSANNPFLTVMIGNFSVKSSNWYLNYVTSFQGPQIEFVASQFAMSQVINEPTHILDNSKSCIDLIFTSQPNMIMDSGVHPSLHSNCHHQIIYDKFDLKIFYLLPYERIVWHFSRANSDHIKKAIKLFDWESSPNNLDVKDQVSVFNETVMKIMPNFVPNELITCDDGDPPWMNRYKKNLTAVRNDFHKKFGNPGNPGNLLMFKNLQNQLIQSIHTAKQRYFKKISKKLCDPLTSTKCYWSLLQAILNEKKVPCIPPIFHNSKYVNDFKEKSEIFNSFSANQCSLIPDNSMLPSELKLLTEHTLTSCDFFESDILQIINNQDSNNADVHGMISICMLKLCVDAIWRRNL